MKLIRTILLVLGVSLLAACSLRPPAPALQGYLLQAARPAAPASTGEALGIRAAAAVQPFGERQLVYRESGQRFVQDFYHVYLSPPAENVSTQARHWLSLAGFAAPADPGASNLLELRIDALYIDVRQPKSPAAVIDMNARLLGPEGDSGRKLLQQWQLGSRQPLASSDADSGMQGLDQALADTLQQLEAALAKQPAN
ncbi:ABC-type transport auxiliary lipoprotein family protein [Chitinilyticum piscinae]|uniref:Membrane integrity-associated transporter subunit PqiC n=1 Tax=Chitinilyticum piscinae TaxID=2866724 RepID=A0A8J7KB82_9NEIS|nr:ABC-type transport auxiliary lipoprotein family protein [Chitinilyticum piscinae]MBE9609949.1 membrane integrity-associated transporter subunit PqiC [Chitinilyticum piscinae]